MISKVKSVTANGTWESKHGILYKFEYTMEDGTVLSAQHKTQDGSFNVGDEVEYTVKGESDYGKYGSVSKPQEQPFVKSGGFTKDPKTQDAILYQTCLKAIAETIGSPQSPEVLASEAFKLAQFSKKYIEQL